MHIDGCFSSAPLGVAHTNLGPYLTLTLWVAIVWILQVRWDLQNNKISWMDKIWTTIGNTVKLSQVRRFFGQFENCIAAVMAKLMEKGLQLARRPPYWPYLALSDYFQYEKMAGKKENLFKTECDCGIE